ncbi:HAD family phosphatase [Nocardioides sp.]|uniref:HAD family hydrolase n=1 Tax=Nocardioides sp. TaxID=35761 RepID=UPI002ED95D42
MTRPSRAAALLLDLDGTLVDTEPMHRAAYRRFFEGHGWEVPDLSLFTGRRAADVFATEAGPWTGEDGHALAREVMACIDPEALPEPVPGAAALLEAAARLGVPVAIVTSAGPAWVRRLAAGPLPGLADVEVLVTAEDVTDGKPDPAGYDLACRRLGVPAADAVAVEDSPAGVRAAVAAGVDTVVGVTTTWDAAALAAAGANRAVGDLRVLAEELT